MSNEGFPAQFNQSQRPPGFWKVCQRFFQDLPELYPGEDNALNFIVGGLTSAERAELAEFLDSELQLPDSSRRLHQLWMKSDADFYIHPEDRTADLFLKIHQRL